MINSIFFHDETPTAVRDILSQYCCNNCRIRLHYGDTKTGKSWLESYHVIGHIRKSCGQQKIPLLVHNSRSFGGNAILDNCIIGIQDVTTKFFLYRHSLFHLNGLRNVGPAVYTNDGIHAILQTEKEATNYVLFQKGDRMRI